MLVAGVLAVGVAIGVLVGRWWVLVLAVAPAIWVLITRGGDNADSGPEWLLTLVFVGVPLAACLALGVSARRRRERRHA